MRFRKASKLLALEQIPLGDRVPYFEGGMVSTELFIWLCLINQVTDCIKKTPLKCDHSVVQ